MVSGDLIEFAGQAPQLLTLARAFELRQPKAASGIDAVLAYLTSELNRAHTAVTDAHELHVLLEVLARPADLATPPVPLASAVAAEATPGGSPAPRGPT